MVEANQSRRRVLIVEDEYYLAADLEAALRSQGADIVGPLCELAEAFREVLKGGFDAAIIDINLQGDRAYGIADQLDRQRIPFVFATGYSREIIPAGFSGVTRFEKPYDVDAIAKYVLQLCDLRQTSIDMLARSGSDVPAFNQLAIIGF